MKPTTVNLPIKGMSCTGCAATIEKVLGESKGVIKSSVNFGTEKATVEFDPESTSLAELNKELEENNYGFVTDTVTIPIKGMHCASCVGSVETVLASTEGVISSNVNLGMERATVTYVPGIVAPNELKKVIREQGYEPVETEEKHDHSTVESIKAQELKTLKNKVIVGAVIGALVFLGSMSSLFTFIPDVLTNWVTLFFLASIIQFWAGAEFYRGTWAALKHARTDMNTLIAMGTSAAYLYSFIVTFFPTLISGIGLKLHIYFDTSVLIITLILLGRYLEAHARMKTNDSIRKLMDLRPKTARVRRMGQEIDIPADEIVVGETIIVRPGERFPADGEISEGTTLVDESMITGEPVPVSKEPGAKVTGGTINQSGQVIMKATGVGKDTLISQIIMVVEEALSSKAPVEKLVDRVAGVFVPVVIAVAVLTFIAWYALGPEQGFTFAFVNFIAVLVVACPCALGLATPTAVMVGVGLGAQSGVLIKNSGALEMASKLKTVILDKTGTLTKGKPEVIDHRSFDFNPTEAIAIAAAAEKNSLHPLAGAMVKFAKDNDSELLSSEIAITVPGKGISAKVEEKHVLLGSRPFMEENGISVTEGDESYSEFTKHGATAIFLAVDKKLAAIFSIKDPVKDNSIEIVRKLKNMGIKVVMLTGDNPFTAKAIADEIGIDEVISGVLPTEKADVVKDEMKKTEPGKVAMVGDGINDAPALTQSDIGIAIGAGEDIAIESADIVLLGSDLSGVLDSINLSRRTSRTIKQNLFFAFIYNILLIPIAAGILYPFLGILMSPIIAAAAMAASSVSVISNSLRLKTFGS